VTGGSGAGGTGGGQPGTCNTPRYDTRTYTSGWADSPAYGAATIYYPIGAPEPLSGVIIVPGFTAMQNSIANWGTYLAQRGFVTMTIDTNATGDFPAARSTALLAALQTLKNENGRLNSPLNGKLAPDSYALMGHSMGGGGTLIASNTNPPGVKAAVPLTPWESGRFTNIRVPTLYLTGSADTLVPPSMARGTYGSIPTSTPKAIAEFQGGSHIFVLNPGSPSGQPAMVGQYAHAWLEIFLHGNQACRGVIQNSSEFSYFNSTL
jgi:alpha-beta hydrolase superfamily lysophospholipase